MTFADMTRLVLEGRELSEVLPTFQAGMEAGRRELEAKHKRELDRWLRGGDIDPCLGRRRRRKDQKPKKRGLLWKLIVGTDPC